MWFRFNKDGRNEAQYREWSLSIFTCRKMLGLKFTFRYAHLLTCVDMILMLCQFYRSVTVLIWVELSLNCINNHQHAMRPGNLGKTSSSPSRKCASFIWQTKTFHAFPTKDLRRWNVPTVLNETMIPFTLLKWYNIDRLERAKKVRLRVAARKDCFEVLLQRPSGCKFGITSKGVTSEGVLISTGLQHGPKSPLLLLPGSVWVSTSPHYTTLPADLWAVLVTHNAARSNEVTEMYSFLTMPEFMQMSTHTNDEII